MPFSTDADLELYDASARTLLSSEPTGGQQYRAVAESDMLHDLEVNWYRRSAEARGICWRSHPLDATRLEPVQLKKLSVFGTLATMCESQSKPDKEPSALERRGAGHRARYREELKALATNGIDYDWDGVGGIATTEKAVQQPRRLRAYK